MRIVLVTEYPGRGSAPNGGVQAVSQTLVRELTKEHEVVVIDPFSETNDSLKCGRLHIIRLRAPENAVSRNLLYPIRVASLAAGQDADIIHVQGWLALASALRALNELVVVTIHGVRSIELGTTPGTGAKLKSGVMRLLEKMSLRSLTYVIANSSYVADMVAKHSSATIWQIPNPIDDIYFGPTNGHGSDIIYVGRVVPLKRVDQIIEAFARVAGYHDETRLIIAGNGETAYVEECKAIGRKLGVEGRIDFLGGLRPAELAPVMDQASVLVLRSSQENAPLVVMESMARGLRIVATAVGSIADMVGSLPGTYLASPKAPVAEFAQLINAALNVRDTPLDKELRKAAAERCTGDVVARATVGVYQSIHSEGAHDRIIGQINRVRRRCRIK